MDRLPEHEKLIVYRRALALTATLEDMAGNMPRHRADLGDQLCRASASIALNIAEGTGEYSPAEKARFYRIARRSAAECLAALDVGARWAAAERTVAAKRDLTEVIAMLTRMVKVVEDRRR